MRRRIIKEEKNRDIPVEAHWEGHRPLKNPVLGTMTGEWRQLDSKHLEKMNGLRKAVNILAFE